MRNHTTTAARADIGRTPQLCQDALIEMLKEKLHRTAEADTGSADVGEEETQCEPIST